MQRVGVEVGDTEQDADSTAKKIAALRFFPGVTPMDKTLAEVDGACLVVSQFTLYGDAGKGNRPSYIEAARPEQAEPLVEELVDHLRALGMMSSSS